MERVDGVPWRVDFAWDDDARLAEVRVSFAPDRVGRRERYTWSGDRLDRIRRWEESIGDVFGDDFADDRAWTWDGDRPIEARFEEPPPSGPLPVETWTWSDGGRLAHVVEASGGRILVDTRAAYDDAMRLLHVESTRTIDDARRVLDLEWAPNGCLAAVRERSGAALSVERLVRYRSDDAGRLLAHSRDDAPDVDLWAYRYDASFAPAIR
ncbi:MAG TPA: hypothetical protein VHB21_03655 [Minicystis sp.]|nr:hypothetical protein [Minicystis sp.]